jgi:hypothetical protein
LDLCALGWPYTAFSTNFGMVDRLGAQPVGEGDLIRAPEQFSGTWSELYGKFIEPNHLSSAVRLETS